MNASETYCMAGRASMPTTQDCRQQEIYRIVPLRIVCDGHVKRTRVIRFAVCVDKMFAGVRSSSQVATRYIFTSRETYVVRWHCERPLTAPNAYRVCTNATMEGRHAVVRRPSVR